jgi:uncharacterized phage infection (PIP) family protein YhgE
LLGRYGLEKDSIMSDEEMTSEESTEPVQETTPDQSSSPGPNPAWNEVLSIIPEQFHQSITPHFQKWDQAAQNRIENINKQYEAYKPFVEHGIDFDTLTQGLQLMHQLNNDPKAVFEQLQTHLGLSPQEAADVMEEMDDSEEEASNPQLEKLQQGFDLLAQRVLDEEQAKENAKFDADLDKEIAAAKEKYGDFDEDYILAKVHAKLMNGEDYTIAQAAEAFGSMRDNILQSNPRPFAPTIIGSNSGNGVGLPSQQVDVTKLDGNATRNLVAEMARRAAQQR